MYFQKKIIVISVNKSVFLSLIFFNVSNLLLIFETDIIKKYSIKISHSFFFKFLNCLTYLKLEIFRSDTLWLFFTKKIVIFLNKPGQDFLLKHIYNCLVDHCYKIFFKIHFQKLV